MTRPRLFRWILALAILATCALPASPSPAVAAAPLDSVRLVSSTETGVVFDVIVPWDQLALEPATAGDAAYVAVSLPDWALISQAGAPALPLLTEAIGVPFDATLTVSVKPGKAHRMALANPPLPATTHKQEWAPEAGEGGAPPEPEMVRVVEPDPAIYAGKAAYPPAQAELATDGVVRQQRVAGIAVYPVQYNPAAKRLIIYETIRVQVSFTGARSAPRGKPARDSRAYENVLSDELLNYESAAAWRRSSESTTQLLSEHSLLSDLQGGTLPWAPPDPGWRVKVREDGLYKLTYTELQSASLPVATLDPRTFRLYNLGDEVAIQVVGEADGVFDPADYILFYGQAVRSKYTRDNVYWLTYDPDGLATGARMGARDGAPVGGATPATFAAERHFEGNAYYLSLLPGDENQDRWMWDYVYKPVRPSSTQTFSLAAPYAAAATLRVAMIGQLQNAVNPDHRALISLNGAQIGDVTWDGITWLTAELPVPAGLLVAGTNTLVVTAGATAYAYDVFYIDWVELEFASAFTAEANALSFGYDAAGDWKFQVAGFTTNQAAVFDITNPALVTEITGVTAAQVGQTYTASFRDVTAAPASYLALTSAALRTVQAIEQDTASNLQATTNSADHIIITHASFAAQAARLRDWRTMVGMRSVVVDLQDVYDEFGYGVAGVAPIHDFLAHAYASWTAPAPSYVVLLGDGHYDPKNYQYSRTSFVPPYLAQVDPWIGETAADNRYVTLDGADNMPDMMLGRMAVNSAAEADAFLDKIETYETNPYTDGWRRQLLAVADNADSGGNFALLSDNVLAACLQPPYVADKIYHGITYTDPVQTRAAILASINAGKGIVNYIGHGYTTGWASENLMTSASVASLSNAGMYPVFLSMDCRDGYYHNPNPLADANSYEALAETITRAAAKGAVASWSPTGLGVATGHDYLNRGFLDAVFDDADGWVSLGEATNAGKLRLWAAGTSLDLLDTYLLFGDPGTMTFNGTPTSVELLSFTATGVKKAIVLNWETASETDNLGFNLYRATSEQGKKTKLNADLIPTNVYPGSPVGAKYEYTDPVNKKKTPYFYWLEDVDIYGGTELHGPVSAQPK